MVPQDACDIGAVLVSVDDVGIRLVKVEHLSVFEDNHQTGEGLIELFAFESVLASAAVENLPHEDFLKEL